MGRYRKYNKSYYNTNAAAKAHVREYRELEYKLGPIVDNIKSYFLKMPYDKRNEIFRKYGSKYGSKAREYAINTLPKWQSGATKMSGQTAKRLINLVPPYLNPGQRHDLVKKLHNHFIEKKHHTVAISLESPNSGLKKLSAITYSLINERTGALPKHVLETIDWINNSDARASKIMLEELDKEININSKSFAEKELSKVFNMVKRDENLHATYEINFINATISVMFVRPKKSIWQRIWG